MKNLKTTFILISLFSFFLVTAPTTDAEAAMWDIQLNADVGLAAGSNGQAGVVFTGTEFWVSRWASDTLYRYTPAGALIAPFTIAGVTGTRGMTMANGLVYIGNATTTIYAVNPSTQTVVSTITAPATARFITYDPTANSGAGGFYIGNFNTDILLISMTGTTLSTITAATHTLGGMYGAAYDGTSAGGPYLWVFYQTGGPSQATIAQLSLPTGVPTGTQHDVLSDVGANSQSNSLAGGLFITNQLVTGQWSMVGLLQANPSNLLFSYHLDFNPISVDAALVGGDYGNGYTIAPVNHSTPLTFTGSIQNQGSQSLNLVRYRAQVFKDGALVYNQSMTTSNLAPLGMADLTLPLDYTPTGVGDYEIIYICSVEGGQNDQVPTNDSTVYAYKVSSNCFARDDSMHNGGVGYAVSSVDWGYATTMFELQQPDVLESVWIEIATPNDGDTTYAVVANVTAGLPTSVFALGDVTIINGTQNIYNLTFPNRLQLTAGTWAIGVYEGSGTTINLSQSNQQLEPLTNHFFVPGTGWVASGIATARFIRPKFETCAAPDDLWVSTATMTAATLNWTTVPEADHYEIRGKQVLGNNWVHLNIPGASTSSKNVFGLLPNTDYHWQIRTHCDAAENETSEWTMLNTFTPGCYPPDSNWVSATSSSGASLNWVPVPQAYGYEIKGRRLPNGVWGTITVGGGQSDQRNVFGLLSGTSYEWTMRTICTQTGNVLSPFTPLQTFTTTTAAKQGPIEIREFGEMPAYVFEIFPNPARHHINVEIDHADAQQLEIINLLGKVIYKSQIHQDQTRLSIATAQWPEGLYCIHLIENNGRTVSSKPFVIAE